jgi:NTP pyrophosphatase (non-canonical NTP hydrolase)
MNNDILKKRLVTIKSLAALKMEKNFIALEKGYYRQPYKYFPIHFWIDKLNEELEEFKIGFNKRDVNNMKEELADLSNVIDYIFELLLSFEMNDQNTCSKDLLEIK